MSGELLFLNRFVQSEPNPGLDPNSIDQIDLDAVRSPIKILDQAF